MTNEPIYGLLDAAEEVIEIAITSDGSGATFPKARAYMNNTLGQLLDGYAKDIGVDPKSEKIIFINSRTNKSTSDKNMTVEEFGLFSGDVLKIEDDSGVAGFSDEEIDMEFANDEIIEISLKNQVSGATYPHARVYVNNTLGQLLDVFAKDVGVNPNYQKIFFVNKRNKKSTNDKNMTVEEFGLLTGDVLEFVEETADYAEKNMEFANDEIIEISLKNQVSGATYPQARVYGNNTLGQLLEGYAKDIGIALGEKRVNFTNKRTGESTSDTNMTVIEFGLINNDVLVVGDDSTVAGSSPNEE